MAVRIQHPHRRRVQSRKDLIGVALLASSIVIAAVILAQGASSQKADTFVPVMAPQFEEIRIPVPRELVPPGARIGNVHFDYVDYPVHQVPPGVIRDVTAFDDAVTLVALPARLPLFPENLSPMTPGSNPLVERITPGMRAMTVRVDETTSIEGWAGSGAVVDVLLIQDTKTAVVAEKVKIISAERVLEPSVESPKIPSTVTLLVTQEQCLAINTAIPLGRIAFALRNNRDEERWGTPTFSADRLKKGESSGTKPSKVTGYVSVTGPESDRPKEFALAGDTWIRTDVIPDGFLVTKERRSRFGEE